MIQDLPIAFAQVKPDNTSEGLLNKITEKYALCSQQKKLIHEFSNEINN